MCRTHTCWNQQTEHHTKLFFPATQAHQHPYACPPEALAGVEAAAASTRFPPQLQNKPAHQVTRKGGHRKKVIALLSAQLTVQNLLQVGAPGSLPWRTVALREQQQQASQVKCGSLGEVSAGVVGSMRGEPSFFPSMHTHAKLARTVLGFMQTLPLVEPGSGQIVLRGPRQKYKDSSEAQKLSWQAGQRGSGSTGVAPLLHTEKKTQQQSPRHAPGDELALVSRGIRIIHVAAAIHAGDGRQAGQRRR